MRLLDLFCGAGGCSVGYHRAGFEVVGVDINPQPNYPYEFIQADAMEFPLDGFDAIHASPPCQAYTQIGSGGLAGTGHPKLIEPIRERLKASGVPYVIENIQLAPLENATLLCGSMFGLGVRRHRLFETSFPMMAPVCQHGWKGEIRAYYGKKGWYAYLPKVNNVQAKGRKQILRGSVTQAPEDMGIDWMQTWDELREAIPPDYTELVGHQLKAHV